MSTNIKRRTYQRLGVVVGTLGLLVIGTMLGATVGLHGRPRSHQP